jgi:NTP pyrophosphatase (non-canonical NTP hydrolase)
MTDDWEAVVAFNDRYFPGWRGQDLVYYSNALAGEAGEFCGLVKKAAGGGTSNKAPPTRAEMLEELSDVWLYLVLAALRVGADEHEFRAAIRAKMRVNEERLLARTSGTASP